MIASIVLGNSAQEFLAAGGGHCAAQRSSPFREQVHLSRGLVAALRKCAGLRGLLGYVSVEVVRHVGELEITILSGQSQCSFFIDSVKNSFMLGIAAVAPGGL